jgi:hypothetical protein
VSILHTAIFAVLPVLFLYSNNWGQVPFSDVLLPLGISLGVAAAVLAALRLALKDWRASALIVSAFLVLFFTYGRLVASLGGSAAVQLAVAALYLAALGLVSWFAVKKRGRLERPTAITNVVAVTLAVMTAVGIIANAATGEPRPRLRDSELNAAISSTEAARPSTGTLPDVYYIILDGYASDGSLEKFFGFDNGGFTRALEERGFFVARESRSNYLQSRLSLASSLNLEYVNYLSEDLGENSRRSGVPNAMIEDNGLARFLKSRGYRFAFFGSNWSGTRSNRNADVSVTEGGGLRGEFMVALLKTTALRGLVAEEEGLCTREGILEAFSTIPGIRDRLDGLAFVFAHMVTPHRPYLFDQNGNPVKGGTDSWREHDRYIDQLKFVNKKTLEMVDAILANSEKPPVIVIQADHGPMPPGDPEGISDPDAEAADLRTGILNAYYLPGGEEQLYEGISPVNSFRVVLNHVCGTDFELLEDRSYASSYGRPYRFKDITDLVVRKGGE